MKRIFGTIFAGFLALVLFFVMLPVMILPSLLTGEKKPDIPTLALLELDLSNSLTDQPHGSSFLTQAAQSPSVIRIVEALARAEDDDRVSGLFVILGDETDFAVAQAEEIRDAFRSFRSGGKFVIVHAQGFNTASLGAYYAASESDELWMASGGRFRSSSAKDIFRVTEAMPGKGARASESDPHKDHAGTAKAFVKSSLIGPRSAARGTIFRAIHDRAIAGIAASKDMRPDQVRKLLGEGHYIASDARIAGLIDYVGARDEARDAALARAGSGAGRITWNDYLKGAGTPFGAGPVIAVVYAEGTINSDGVETDEAFSINGNTTANAIRGAADDESVEAILFRIDSAGGSAIASGQIWDAVTYARGSGKPVVVSMGSVAASGGYYVAMAADRIIAQPTTITGSIGVVDGEFVLGSEYGAQGLIVSETMAGAPGVETSPAQTDPADAGWQSVNKVLGNFYADFTVKVAEGRGMSLEAVHEVASGRPWSGAQAMELGLIDELGGFRLAIGETKTMLGLDANAPVELRTWPGPASRLQRMAQMRDVSGTAARIMLMFSQLGQVETLKDLMESVSRSSQPAEQPDE